jgi:hypothetical protein
MRHRQTLMLLGVGPVALILAASDALAERGERLVTGCSRFGKGCITAPTRPGKFGPDVRLPGGTWISCKLDCPTTLRDETVDFWMKREWERGDPGFRRR